MNGGTLCFGSGLLLQFVFSLKCIIRELRMLEFLVLPTVQGGQAALEAGMSSLVEVNLLCVVL